MRYQCSRSEECGFETDNLDELIEIEEREIGEWVEAGDVAPAGKCPSDECEPGCCRAAVYDTHAETWRAQRLTEIVRGILWPDGDLEHEWSSDEIGDVADAMNLFGFRPKVRPEVKEPAEAEYRVEWSMTVTAPSAQAAAESALNGILEPGADVRTFDVFGDGDTKPTRVDFGDPATDPKT